MAPEDALAHLADLLPPAQPALAALATPDPPTGELTGKTVAAAVGALLPEGAIAVDEANTSGLWLPAATAGAPRHDWLTLTGGAIGQGLPLAAGAALACPDRPVVCLEADGSAMYTLQALWTMAREDLNITTVILANRSYSVLEMEYDRLIPASTAAGHGHARRDLLDLSRPGLDFVELAQGMGVPALARHHRRGLHHPVGQGPRRARSPPRRGPRTRALRPRTPDLTAQHAANGTSEATQAARGSHDAGETTGHAGGGGQGLQGEDGAAASAEGRRGHGQESRHGKTGGP